MNNNKRFLIEQLLCVALGGAVMIALASAGVCFYKYTMNAIEQQQEQQTNNYDEYNYILNEVM